MTGFSRRHLLLALAGCGAGVRAQTVVPAEVSEELPGARLQGSGRLTFFGLHIYDARLWVQDGFTAEAHATTPLALELDYARTLYGSLIAERSLDEMKRAGGFSEEQGQRWLDAMRKVFVDVNRGDRITGVHRPGDSARFFLNGKSRGEIRDADFARRFFGIWLAPATSEPKLRLALLGLVRANP